MHRLEHMYAHCRIYCFMCRDCRPSFLILKLHRKLSLILSNIKRIKTSKMIYNTPAQDVQSSKKYLIIWKGVSIF